MNARDGELELVESFDFSTAVRPRPGDLVRHRASGEPAEVAGIDGDAVLVSTLDATYRVAWFVLDVDLTDAGWGASCRHLRVLRGASRGAEA